MNKIYPIVALFVITLLSGCELIGDIFAAGAYTGIFIVVIIIALIIWLLSKFRGRG
ncbi:MAG: hypothetical protein ACO1NS_00475 [Daejeonella sp.]|uniref:hypothetical protein n=1 Tax=Daejeonella sp. JGW-45 TaxID=3034148 RepID=UPI0023EC2528|nr:hypothetical protein [Daejeonella sp. JGW-45]